MHLSKKSQLLSLALALILGIFLISYFNWEEILFAKKGFFRWFPFVCIIFLFPFIAYQLLNFLPEKMRAYRFTYAIITILIFGPLYGIVQKNASELDNIDLWQETEAVIIKKEWFHPRRNGAFGHWTVVAQFKANGKTYQTFSAEDRNDYYAVGDTVEVLYSRENPENSQFILIE